MELMQASAILQLANSAELTDEEVVTRVLNGETALFEILMRRYNQRLYRVARSILRDDGEAEDVMQDAYVRAYQHLGQFAGRAKFSTWLTRIAVHEALARAHRGKRYDALEGLSAVEGETMKFASAALTPEQEVATAPSHVTYEEAMLPFPQTERPGSVWAELMSRGRRTSRQRITILRFVETGKRHLDASQIRRKSCKVESHSDRVTVYRAVALVRRCGLVDELNMMRLG